MDSEETTIRIHEEAGKIVNGLLPGKSAEIYKQCHEQFKKWQNAEKTTSLSEETMLVYFQKISKELKPSTVWSRYSMLKTTVRNFHNVDIAKYKRLIAFLTQNSKGYLPTKSKTLDSQDVQKFLAEAPDEIYLSIKVALIFGVCGACRREELKNIKLDDIERREQLMVVNIPRTKNDAPRKFIVDGDFLKIVEKYQALRPKNVKTNEFFLTLRNGRCTQQVIGINTFGAMPKVIATYLGLKDAERYTGHSFRRTSATMLADAGADIMTLKRHGGWKSDKVAQGYVDESIHMRKKICHQISQSIQLDGPQSTQIASSSGQANENTNKENINGSEFNLKTSRKSASTSAQGRENENLKPMAKSSMPQRSNTETSPMKKVGEPQRSNTEPPFTKKIAIEMKDCSVTFNFTAD